MARTISLSLPEDLYKWLEGLAEREGKKVQQVIRELLEEARTIRKYKINVVFNAIENIKEAVDELKEFFESKIK